MIRGFGLIELLVALTIGVTIVSIVIANVTQATKHSKQITSKQQRLEAIFHTVDAIKSDLNKCGMRLQEVSREFGLPLFNEWSEGFSLVYGMSSDKLTRCAFAGDRELYLNQNQHYKKRKKIVVYSIALAVFEICEIKEVNGERIQLTTPLKNDYSEDSQVVVLREIGYKWYTKQNTLKRKINRGYYQPLIEEVTDFFVKYFPESKSVLYRIEINRKEQIRGYIFMKNMVW